jgi:hypothetical protein
MKATNTIEEAVVGRTIKLSVIECIVIANLISNMSKDMNEKRDKITRVETQDLVNLRNMVIKFTGQDIVSLSDAEEHLFAPVEEEIRYNLEGEVITSTVEAYSGGHREGEHKVGKILLKMDKNNNDGGGDEMNELVDLSS